MASSDDASSVYNMPWDKNYVNRFKGVHFVLKRSKIKKRRSLLSFATKPADGVFLGKKAVGKKEGKGMGHTYCIVKPGLLFL